MGRYDLAERYFKRALIIFEAAYGSYDSRTNWSFDQPEKPASFGIDQVLEKLQAGGATSN